MAEQRTRWLDRPGNVRKIYLSVWVACGLLLLAELFVDKHGEVAVEHWFGFHGFYGFVVFIFVVLAGKELRKVLMRGEDYYDR